MKKIVILLLYLSFYFHGVDAQNLLSEKWKFKTGDDPSWALNSYDDASWGEIIPGTSWEKQGYSKYDGFAWYRVTVVVPSSLKEVVKKYGGMSLQLGKIDDVDFTYFNGKLVGNMGQLPPKYKTKYNEERNYIVPYSLISWDQPNIIAVRVFDLTGDGGLYAYPSMFTIKGVSDKVTITPQFREADDILKATDGNRLQVNLNNQSRTVVSGHLILHVVSDFGKPVTDFKQDVTLPKRTTLPVDFDVSTLQPGFYKVHATFEGAIVYVQSIYSFGYEPEKIVSPPNRNPDFESYWKETKAELAKVPPQFKLMKADSFCSSKRTVYLVEMHSLGNVVIHGWYSVPTKPGKHPAIMQVPGYSGSVAPGYVNYGEDIIGFALDIRGHGYSKGDVNPGFPGYLFSGIQDKETYIYRGAYMDCVRGIDFLFSRPEVDTTRVGVEGGSQGGALTFATAALDNNRIRVCVPQIPFLSDFPDYFQLAGWPANEFKDFVNVQKKMTWDQVYNTLSYIDIKNLAGWIKAPMMMGVGLEDDICPPHINFAAYNQVTSEKHYLVYPHYGHGLPQDFYTKRMKFIREKFGLESGK